MTLCTVQQLQMIVSLGKDTGMRVGKIPTSQPNASFSSGKLVIVRVMQILHQPSAGVECKLFLH